MHARKLLFLVALAVVAASLGAGAAPIRNVIKIDSGTIRGTDLEEGGRIFKGIPYAAPPVGPLRWRPPQPVLPWDGVRDATTFAPVCPQPKPMVGRFEGRASEDCLYLNVWTPAESAGAALPVMVWIHGGGFTTGAGSWSVYDGARLAREGVVVVTINYRLGPFGFLAHPLLSAESSHGVSGNYGLLDQIAALQWVSRNIAAFGGDPERITIFGESAGSVSVCLHLVSPLSEGLFHRAIAESGSARGRHRHLRETWYGMEPMERMGERIANELGCEDAGDPLAALREVSAQDLLSASDPAQGLFGKGNKFGPCVDGYVLPDDPGKMFEEGRQHPVPVLAGFNANEGTVFLGQLRIRRAAGYRFLLRTQFGADAKRLLELLPVQGDDDLESALDRLVTVSVFTSSIRALARAMKASGGESFLYEFTQRPRVPWLDRYGAFHSFEIFFVFGNLPDRLRFDATDRSLSKTIRSYWTTFAATGNPNREGRTPWPAYDPEKDTCLELGATIRSQACPDAQACDIFDRIHGKQVRQRRDPKAFPERPRGN